MNRRKTGTAVLRGAVVAGACAALLSGTPAVAGSGAGPGDHRVTVAAGGQLDNVSTIPVGEDGNRTLGYRLTAGPRS